MNKYLTLKDHLQIQIKNSEFTSGIHTYFKHVPVIRSIFYPYQQKNDELNAIFCHIPKAAGSSISTSIFGSKVGHKPISRYYLYDEIKAVSYFKFTFVRNPWGRLYSAFTYFNKTTSSTAHRDHRWASQQLQGIHSFNEFVLALANDEYRRKIKQYDHFRDQIDWLMYHDRIAMDYIGRFERLSDDFQHICHKIGVKCKLPHLNPSVPPGTDYKKAYTASMVEIVGDMYRQDIKLLGYRFDD